MKEENINSHSPLDDLFDTSRFENEYTDDRRQAAEEEREESEDQVGFDSEQQKDNYAEEAEFILKLIDESRAFGLSMWTGKSKERYLAYKNLNKDHYMVKAMARIILKYSVKNTSDWTVAIGLIVSSMIVFNKASADKKSKARRQSPKTNDEIIEDAQIIED